MHTGDLGVLSVFLASVLWELTFDGPFAGRIDTKIAQIYTLIQGAYDELQTPSRIGQLKRV